MEYNPGIFVQAYASSFTLPLIQINNFQREHALHLGLSSHPFNLLTFVLLDDYIGNQLPGNYACLSQGNANI